MLAAFLIQQSFHPHEDFIMTASNQSPTVWDSAVGKVVDVATYSPSKLYRRAIGWMFVAAGMFLSAVAGWFELSKPHADELVGICLYMTVSLFPLATGVRRLMAASEKDCYFRAGPGGISVRIPGFPTLSSLTFRYKMAQFDIPWSAVRQWRPHILRINFILFAWWIEFIDNTDHFIANIPMFFFSQSYKQVVEKITEASKMDISAKCE
jgi:hypothetical protein